MPTNRCPLVVGMMVLAMLNGCGSGSTIGKDERFHLTQWQEALDRLELRPGDPVAALDEFMEGKYRETGETRRMGNGGYFRSYLVDDIVQVTATVDINDKFTSQVPNVL